MADWKEIERLQSDFQRAQESTFASKLSERNCIEILLKLQEMKLIEVLHTMDGKEYLTPQKLTQEIRDELYVHGGRVSLVELQSLLNVDYSHIETKANEIVASNRSIYIVLGQLLDKTYLDHIAEEINENLQSAGQVTIADLCRTYDLPGDFLVPEIVSRLGSIIKGRLDETNKDAIFTESYISRYKSKIRGILTAITQPTSLQPILSDCEMSAKLFYSIVEDLITEKRISGEIIGKRSDKSTYMPYMFVRTQNQYVDNFFKQNNYLEYETLKRLEIDDLKGYIRQRYGDTLSLSTACVGSTIVRLATASVEDALTAKSWADIASVVPTPLSSGDCEQLLHHVLKNNDIGQKEKRSIVVESYFACDGFIESCCHYFEPLVKQKAEESAKKRSVFSLTEEEMKQYGGAMAGDGKTKADRRDDRRKKAVEGSGSARRATGGGSGIGGREVKTRGKDKKRLKKQREMETERGEEDSRHGSMSQQEEFMDSDEMIEMLAKHEPQCPEVLLERIIDEIHPFLNRSFREQTNSVFQLAMSQQQKEKSDDSGSGQVSNRPKKTRKSYEEEINAIWCNAKLLTDGLQNFEGDILTSLQKHLLKSACTDLVNVVFNMIGSEHLAGLEDSRSMTAETRVKILTRIPENYRAPLKRLNQTLNGKSLEDFNAALTESLSADICDVMLKKLDKKRERQILHGHKMSLLQQLEKEAEPAMALHLATMIVFQNITGQMLHITGKFVPNIISWLTPQVGLTVSGLLIHFESLVTQKLSAGEEGDTAKIDAEISDELPKLREMAATVKKKSASTSEQ